MPRAGEWRTGKEMVKDAGFYNKWNAQVMADIVLPLVIDENPPFENEHLEDYRYQSTINPCGEVEKRSIPEHTIALYLVRELFRNLGLVSTEKVFEAEAALHGTGHDFQQFLKEYFSRLTMSGSQELQPPMLAQLLFLVMFHSKKNKQIPTTTTRGEDESRQIRGGVPQNMGSEAAEEYHQDSATVQSCDFEDEGTFDSLMRMYYPDLSEEYSHTFHAG